MRGGILKLITAGFLALPLLAAEPPNCRKLIEALAAEVEALAHLVVDRERIAAVPSQEILVSVLDDEIAQRRQRFTEQGVTPSDLDSHLREAIQRVQITPQEKPDSPDSKFLSLYKDEKEEKKVELAKSAIQEMNAWPRWILPTLIDRLKSDRNYPGAAELLRALIYAYNRSYLGLPAHFQREHEALRKTGEAIQYYYAEIISWLGDIDLVDEYLASIDKPMKLGRLIDFIGQEHHERDAVILQYFERNPYWFDKEVSEQRVANGTTPISRAIITGNLNLLRGMRNLGIPFNRNHIALAARQDDLKALLVLLDTEENKAYFYDTFIESGLFPANLPFFEKLKNAGYSFAGLPLNKHLVEHVIPNTLPSYSSISPLLDKLTFQLELHTPGILRGRAFDALLSWIKSYRNYQHTLAFGPYVEVKVRKIRSFLESNHAPVLGDFSNGADWARLYRFLKHEGAR